MNPSKATAAPGRTRTGQEAARALWWAVPALVCIALYWDGIWAWFAQDDFAWLGLRLGIHSLADLWSTLFHPMAQGTVRPLSERGFFLLFEWLFGLDALPFRLWVLATEIANLALLASIALRLTRSRVGGLAAPLLWVSNAALASPMSWTSAYNQVLLSFFILLSFRLWLRYTDTGAKRFLVWQWVTFLLGFGANELNVVYPALAAAWALFFARRRLLHTVPMFVVSAAYAVIHRLNAPRAEGVYAMHWDLSMWRTLRTYFKWALGPELIRSASVNGTAIRYLTLLLTAAVLGFVLYKLWKREWLAAICAAWFLLPLAPVLPLRDHMMQYYLTVPAIGLALLGAWALAEAARASRLWLALVLALLCVSVSANATAGWRFARWERERSTRIRTLVGSVLTAHELHPRKVIVLDRLPSEAFWGTFTDNPFRLLGIGDVFLSPRTEQNIEAHPEIQPVSDYVIPPPVLRAALESAQAVVYDASGAKLRNITSTFAASFLAEPAGGVPPSLDFGNPLYQSFLGTGWYQAEEGHRWMSKRATFRISAPKSAGSTLRLSGYATADFLRGGSISLHVWVNGTDLGRTPIAAGDESFIRDFRLPPPTAYKDEMEVTLESSATFRVPGDGRDLSFVFGRASVR